MCSRLALLRVYLALDSGRRGGDGPSVVRPRILAVRHAAIDSLDDHVVVLALWPVPSPVFGEALLVDTVGAALSLRVLIARGAQLGGAELGAHLGVARLVVEHDSVHGLPLLQGHLALLLLLLLLEEVLL